MEKLLGKNGFCLVVPEVALKEGRRMVALTRTSGLIILNLRKTELSKRLQSCCREESVTAATRGHGEALEAKQEHVCVCV